jgi:heme/copper-type cytochrome/quinol oxidase subunit 3
MPDNLPQTQISQKSSTNAQIIPMSGYEVRQASNLGLPDQSVTNFVWKIIIISFAIVLVSSSLLLAIAIVFFQKQPTDAGLQMLLTIFTLVVGFFAGLLSPSPLHKS